jgi:uncharacterized membrane protein YeiB
VAAALWWLPSLAVAAVGVGSAVAGFALRWYVLERELDGLTTGWLTEPAGTPLGLVIDVFVNGTHPLFPWLAFLCAGIVLGRLFDKPWWREAAIALGIALFSVATMVSIGATGPRRGVLLASDPFSRSLVYTASALGTALVVFATVSALADRFADSPIVHLLRRSGQLSLTIYVLHALVFKLLVDWVDVVDPGTIWAALGFAALYWVLALVAAAAYQRRFGRGPVEQLYRALTG